MILDRDPVLGWAASNEFTRFALDSADLTELMAHYRARRGGEPENEAVGWRVVHTLGALDDQKNIDIHCFYADGCQVGAFARYVLLKHYRDTDRKFLARKLEPEIRRDYPDAINHAGRLLLDVINDL